MHALLFINPSNSKGPYEEKPIVRALNKRLQRLRVLSRPYKQEPLVKHYKGYKVGNKKQGTQ